MNKLKPTGQFFKTLITFLVGVPIFGYNVQSKILHDVTCGSNSTNFSLDWDETPSSTQFNWAANGTTTFTASNIQGSGSDVAFSVTGATGTLATEVGKLTPSINTSLSVGADALHISSSGLTAGEEMVLTMTFTPVLAGNIAFDLYFKGVSESFNEEVVKFDGSQLCDNEALIEMKVYPNPMHGSLLTLISSKTAAGEVALEIMTAEGQFTKYNVAVIPFIVKQKIDYIQTYQAPFLGIQRAFLKLKFNFITFNINFIAFVEFFFRN